MKTLRDRHFYLSPPTYFEIEYVINEWMDINIKVDKSLAEAQWQTLLKTYEELGIKITVLDPIEGLPDLVFPGDAIFLFGDQAIASNFRHEERSQEVPPRAEWFSKQGFTVHSLPEELHFEGNAEAILWNGRLLTGYGLRSDREVYPYLSDILDIEIVPLRVHAPYFHLDVAVCPLDDETIAYAPDALGEDSRAMIEALAPKTIKVSKEEAKRLVVNSIVVEDTVILSTKEAPQFCVDLEEHGFKPVALDMGEFYKSGGGVKCLTLEAYQPVKQKV